MEAEATAQRSSADPAEDRSITELTKQLTDQASALARKEVVRRDPRSFIAGFPLGRRRAR